MSDELYQKKVWSDIELKKGKVQGIEGFEKNVIQVNNQYAVLIKYCSNQIAPSFQFTSKEIDDLFKIEKIFPLSTYVVFTTEKKIACSISLKELEKICNIRSFQRSIYIEDITLSGYLLKSSLGEKRFDKKEYLEFL